MMEIPKDVVVFHDKEQNSSMMLIRNNIINCFWIHWEDSFPFFSCPGRRDGWWPYVLFASNESVIYCVTHINNKDDGDIAAARARGYGCGLPIILETITENTGSTGFVCFGGESSRRRVAIYGMSGQPKAGKSGADISTKLPFLGLHGIPHLGQLAAHGVPLQERREESKYSNPRYYSSPNGQLASDNRKSPSFSYKRVLLGATVIGLGWIFLWFSFESFDKIPKSPQHIACGVILGLVAITLIGHGLFYACLGVWGLPSLYIL
jgi:hypothetical protein